MSGCSRAVCIVILACFSTAVFAVSEQKAKPASQETSSPATKRPSASELLDKYAETQDKLKSFILKFEVDGIEGSTSFLRLLRHIGKGKAGSFTEIRFDGRRVRRHCRLWGHIGMKPEFTPKNEAKYQSRLWDGKTFFQYDKGDISQRGGRLHIRDFRDDVKKVKDIYESHRRTPLRGFLEGDVERVDSILRKADTISVRHETERVGKSQCYIIDAVTRHGKYEVYIDPEHGYNIAKATVERARGDVVFIVDYVLGARERMFFSMENVRFRKIDDIWVLMEADIEYDRTFRNGSFYRSKYHHKRTQFILNPDHDALGSFIPDDIEDGTTVPFFANLTDDHRYNGSPQYKWSKDAKFVADANGHRVRYDPNEGLFPVVKTLPKFSYFDLRLSPNQTADKKIVVCFCNLDQPSSQQCVLTLRDRASSLAKKDLIIILVQAAPIETKRLNDWASTHNVTFPVGKFDDGIYNEVLKAWGVRSLPWLVLTDKEQVVIAEGVGLNELDDRIRQSSGF
jgi:hypothetical protein